jgi:hypothetical protein
VAGFVRKSIAAWLEGYTVSSVKILLFIVIILVNGKVFYKNSGAGKNGFYNYIRNLSGQAYIGKTFLLNEPGMLYFNQKTN